MVRNAKEPNPDTSSSFVNKIRELLRSARRKKSPRKPLYDPSKPRPSGARKLDWCTMSLMCIHWGIVLPGLTILLLAMLARLGFNPENKWAPTTASENAVASENATTASRNATTPSENAIIAYVESMVKFAIAIVSFLVFYTAYKIYGYVVRDVVNAFWSGTNPLCCYRMCLCCRSYRPRVSA